MRILLKTLGAACFVLAAISVLFLIALIPDTAGIIFFGALAVCFTSVGCILFKKAKPAAVEEKAAPIEASAPIFEPDPVKPILDNKPQKLIFGVAGVYYRQEEIIRDLMTESYEYGLSKKEIIEEGLEETRIYKYELFESDAHLVPEPENPHDPNAIKVMVSDVLIGYVPAEKTARVKSILDKKDIVKLTCQIYGGEYRYLQDEDSSIEHDSTNLKASVSISFK